MKQTEMTQTQTDSMHLLCMWELHTGVKDLQCVQVYSYIYGATSIESYFDGVK